MTPTKPTSKPPLDQLEAVFKALADKTRLRILALLAGDEVCVCHIHDSLRLPQPTVSRHLAYLRRVGLVTARRDGLWMHYSVTGSLSPAVQKVVDAALTAMKQVTTATDDRKQFQRAFGQLYVLPSPSGGACCAPRGTDAQ